MPLKSRAHSSSVGRSYPLRVLDSLIATNFERPEADCRDVQPGLSRAVVEAADVMPLLRICSNVLRGRCFQGQMKDPASRSIAPASLRINAFGFHTLVQPALDVESSPCLLALFVFLFNLLQPFSVGLESEPSRLFYPLDGTLCRSSANIAGFCISRLARLLGQFFAF